MDQFFCIPGFAYFLFDLEVTPGASIRLLPENVECNDRAFPFPWSGPINDFRDYYQYASVLSPVFATGNDFSYFSPAEFYLGGRPIFSLRLGPYWQEVFGGCGSKLKVCVRDGTIQTLTFYPTNELICCPGPEEEPLPPCDCVNQVLLPFKINGFREPADPDFSAYWFMPFFDIDTPCDSGTEGFVLPRWVAENGADYATQWIGKVLRRAYIENDSTLFVCDFGNGYIAFGAERNEEILELCDYPVANCSGYHEALPDGTRVLDNWAVILDYYYGGPRTEYHETVGRFYCCDEPPPPPTLPYPPNYCLPPCGCERACDAVGCFSELSVRLKSGLSGYPAPGATVTVLVQEGHRKMFLTGVYDGVGVKITLTPQQRKFFVFFRAYSVAVFWNGQIWPMADGGLCKYFVAYPGPSQTTLTI